MHATYKNIHGETEKINVKEFTACKDCKFYAGKDKDFPDNILCKAYNKALEIDDLINSKRLTEEWRQSKNISITQPLIIYKSCAVYVEKNNES